MVAVRHVDGTMHSHGGGPMHSHLPPGASGEKITWRSLLTLGISGGLVPCPSAMVLLLAAVALNKTAYGMLLVVAFSVGLAITLTAVGLGVLVRPQPLPQIGTRGTLARGWIPIFKCRNMIYRSGYRAEFRGSQEFLDRSLAPAGNIRTP